MVDLATAMAQAAQSPEPELIRAEIGRMALGAQTISEEVFVSRFAPFVGQAWPNQLRVTTVNARTGQLQIWDASSGAPLERAIAASTAAPCIWRPITINGERYIDGGVRIMLNADLAIGSDIVISVSCFPLTARDEAGPALFKAMNAAPLAELDAVRGSGATLALSNPAPSLSRLPSMAPPCWTVASFPKPTAWDNSQRSARPNRFAAFGIRVTEPLKKYPVRFGAQRFANWPLSVMGLIGEGADRRVCASGEDPTIDTQTGKPVLTRRAHSTLCFGHISS
jgi:NTE family protein